MTTLKNQIAWYAKAQYVLAAVTLLVVGFFYFGIYRSQDVRLREFNRLIAMKRMELSSNQNQANRLPRVTMELEGLKQKLAGFKKLPPEPELGQFIRDITQVSQRASLRNFTMKPGVPRRSELYSEQPISLTFTGDFTSVCSFIHQLEDMERLTRVRAVTIKSAAMKPGSTDAQGMVNVTLSVNIYYSEG